MLAKSVGEGMGEAEGQPGWRHLQGQPSVGRRVRTARTKAADKKSWKVPPLLAGQLLSPARFAICISSSRLNLQRKKNQRLAAETLSPSHCVSGWAQVFAESVGRRPSSESALGSDGPRRDLPLPRESIAKVVHARSSSDNCFRKVKPLSLQAKRTRILLNFLSLLFGKTHIDSHFQFSCNLLRPGRSRIEICSLRYWLPNGKFRWTLLALCPSNHSLPF